MDRLIEGLLDVLRSAQEQRDDMVFTDAELDNIRHHCTEILQLALEAAEEPERAIYLQALVQAFAPQDDDDLESMFIASSDEQKDLEDAMEEYAAVPRHSLN